MVQLGMLIIGFLLFITGFLVYNYPRKVIRVPFIRGFGGYNFSDKSLNKSYEERYGVHKALKYMRLNGLFLMVVSAATFLAGLFVD
jgi:hypothetical protein